MPDELLSSFVSWFSWASMFSLEALYQVEDLTVCISRFRGFQVPQTRPPGYRQRLLLAGRYKYPRATKKNSWHLNTWFSRNLLSKLAGWEKIIRESREFGGIRRRSTGPYNPENFAEKKGCMNKLHPNNTKTYRNHLENLTNRKIIFFWIEIVLKKNFQLRKKIIFFRSFFFIWKIEISKIEISKNQL